MYIFIHIYNFVKKSIAIDYIYTVKIARFAISSNYLLLSVVVHYTTVRNNNVLRVNSNFNSSY